MIKIKLSKKIYSILFSVIFCFAILFFQNCSQVNLKTLKSNPGRVIGEDDPRPTFIKPPTSQSTKFRAAFIVDMSFSMQGDACSDTLDMLDIGAENLPENASRGTQNCSLPSGVDTIKKRLDTIKKWIQDTHQILEARENYDPNETFKVSIIPFSGPPADDMMRTGRLDEPEVFDFRSVEDSLRFLDKLSFVQHCYNNTSSCNVPAGLSGWQWSATDSSQFIGTSVPGLAFSKLSSSLTEEMQKLNPPGDADYRSQSRFEVVYISDGVPKPRIDHIVEVAKIAWGSKTSTTGCIERCSNLYKNYLHDTGYSMIGGIGQPTCRPSDLDPYTDCFQELNNLWLYDQEYTSAQIADEEFEGVETGRLQALTASLWGEAKDNDTLNIFRKLKDIKNIFGLNPMAQFRQSFIRIDSDIEDFKTYENQLDPEINWIEKSKSVFVSNYRYAVQTSNAEPFELFPALSSFDSYRLKHIVALNLNARLNSAKKISADSDGDGLLDEDEARSGGIYDSKKSRTDGFCLDSVRFLMNGCQKVSCDVLLDEDGDGLNECDEKTLLTSAIDFDTDDDGIPDGLEMLMGYSPVVGDHMRDDNYDSLMNYANFSQGLPPWAFPSQINSSNKSFVEVGFSSYKTVVTSLGEEVQVPGYTVQLKSMPLIQTQAVSSDTDLFVTRSHTNESKWNYSVIGGNHSDLTNAILIFAKIENYQNPQDFYWITKKVTIPFGDPIVIDFDFENMDYRIVPDPQWSGY